MEVLEAWGVMEDWVDWALVDVAMGEDLEVTQVALGKVLVVLAEMVVVIMALVAPTKASVEVLEDQCRLGMMALERHSK